MGIISCFPGGGGGGVSLDVIAVSELPATVVENQIVVITDTPAGTIYVDTDEPANPVSGDVWVQVGSSDTGLEFSETFRNGLMQAAQYSGGWNTLAGHVGINGIWEQFSVVFPTIGTPLNNWAWAQINFVAMRGWAMNYFAIGDTKNININGVSYVVEIIGINHDDLADGSGKAGITFSLQNCLNTLYAMNLTTTNVGSWRDSYMRSNLQTNIFDQLENDLKAVIKPIIKKTSAGDRNSTIVSTVDTLFLFSESEIFGQASQSYAGEGNLYFFFTTTAKRIKRLGSTARIWWLRSPSTKQGSYFCYVSDKGEPGVSSTAGESGVAFGFCV